MLSPNLNWINFLATTLLASSFLVAETTDSGKLVTAEGFSFDLNQVEQEAASELKELQMEELRAPARIKMKRHEILQETMEEMAADRLLQLEAKKRGISVKQLEEIEIQHKIDHPSNDELERLYELNKNRLPGTREEKMNQINSFVIGQKRKEARSAYTRELAEKYNVRYLLPPVRFDIPTEGHPSLGPTDAPVTILEFSDFECPHCARSGEILHKIYLEFDGKVRIVFRQYPLWMIHPQSPKAAEAALCAYRQGKFWEMHNLLFAEQDSLDPEGLKKKASQLNLDRKAFDECLDSGACSNDVDRDLIDGSRAGVSGTPAFFVNGRPLEVKLSYESIRALVVEELEFQHNPVD